MPYPSFSINDNEYHFSHCKEIADILSLSQHTLDEFYRDEEDILMYDDLRTKLFGMSFGKLFHASCIGGFGFLDIYIEHGSLLHQHCDNNNDHRNSYTYGASYETVNNKTTIYVKTDWQKILNILVWLER